MTRKRALKIAIVVAVGLALGYSCMRDKTSNDATAAVAREGETYRITLTGTRYLMVHDPISALMARTYEETYELDLPRIEGVVQGTEIPRPRGWYKLLGTVTFDGDRMTVDLYYDNTDDKIRDPLSWNGVYTLRFAKGE